ncbi:hypothetical protein Q4519_08625 [Motilimonas sp. 1_MG-2023]|uniref:hypothetical protein n=1 Tax=Motilimonas sp. 1_MG-2023 TaxID=3062672 RepID=UPI0026E3515E|nr:hypothetical protein [Motilimonas sp. 1_MG-2023]MDO6525747.1 hypothetical protein [Motilimonas sp. 1_MG-2023]
MSRSLGRRIPMLRMQCWQQGQVRVGWLGAQSPVTVAAMAIVSTVFGAVNFRRPLTKA